MKTTLKTILLEYLNANDGWVSKGQLGLIAEQSGYLPESCGRHLRKMAKLGEIQVSYYKGKRKQQLSRYARLDIPKPIINKPVFKEVNGQFIAVYENQTI